MAENGIIWTIKLSVVKNRSQSLMVNTSPFGPFKLLSFFFETTHILTRYNRKGANKVPGAHALEAYLLIKNRTGVDGCDRRLS